MDYYKIFLGICFLLGSQAAHIPEVYESNNFYKLVHDFYEKPPEFNYQEYQKGTQFDPQRIRYQQQQQLDALNTKPKQAKAQEETKKYTQLSTSRPLLLKDLGEKTPQISKGRIAKKSLKPNSYVVHEELEIGQKRQDDSNYLNYVERNPKELQQNHGGFVAPTPSNHLHALTSLLGQTPENQLHGLRQLLNGVGNRYFSDSPIKDDVIDFSNAQNKPNIQTHNKPVNNQAFPSLNFNKGNSPDSLKSLQAQLDATASAHAESIIAQAQKKALEHVKAQHEAISRAQKTAEQAAVEQIKAQNEALAREHAEQQAVAKREKDESEKKKKRAAAERRRQQEQARERARLTALVLKQKQEQEVKEKEQKEQNEDVHTLPRKVLIKNAHKLKKFYATEPAETQNHYFTSPTQITHYQPQRVTLHQPITTEQTYRQPIQMSSLYEQKPAYNEKEYHADVSKYFIPPQFTVVGQTKNIHGESELHYAANYEFGYRIRDYDHGNDYGHKETKDGDTTKGEYHTLLPDGRVQTVSYYVDDSGYHADVSYGGASEATGVHH